MNPHDMRLARIALREKAKAHQSRPAVLEVTGACVHHHTLTAPSVGSL